MRRRATPSRAKPAHKHPIGQRRIHEEWRKKSPLLVRLHYPMTSTTRLFPGNFFFIIRLLLFRPSSPCYPWGPPRRQSRPRPVRVEAQGVSGSRQLTWPDGNATPTRPRAMEDCGYLPRLFFHIFHPAGSSHHRSSRPARLQPCVANRISASCSPPGIHD